MFSQETEHASPDIGNACMRAKELWVIGGFIGSGAVGHRAGNKPPHVRKRNCGQTGEGRVYVNQHLNFVSRGKTRRR